MVAEHRDHFLSLAHAKKAMIDKDASELIANGLMDERRRDRTINPARQAANHLSIADLFANGGDRLVMIARHRPIAAKTCDGEKILIELRAIGGMMHLGVELHRVKTAVHIGGDRKRRAWGSAKHFEPIGNFADMVAVAHPNLFAAILRAEPSIHKI